MRSQSCRVAPKLVPERASLRGFESPPPESCRSRHGRWAVAERPCGSVFRHRARTPAYCHNRARKRVLPTSFSGEESKVQRGLATCPRALARWEERPGSSPGLWTAHPTPGQVSAGHMPGALPSTQPPGTHQLRGPQGYDRRPRPRVLPQGLPLSGNNLSPRNPIWKMRVDWPAWAATPGPTGCSRSGSASLQLYSEPEALPRRCPWPSVSRAWHPASVAPRLHEMPHAQGKLAGLSRPWAAGLLDWERRDGAKERTSQEGPDQEPETPCLLSATTSLSGLRLSV